jgi:hypothetical protein
MREFAQFSAERNAAEARDRSQAQEDARPIGTTIASSAGSLIGLKMVADGKGRLIISDPTKSGAAARRHPIDRRRRG